MRIFALAGLALTLLVIAVLGALIVLRLPAAQFGFDWAAERFGPPGTRANVEQIDLTQLALTDLRLGRDAEVAAARVAVTIQLGSLLEDKIDEVAIDGLTLALDLRPDAQPLGSLQPLVDGLQGGDATAAPIVGVSLVRFRDGRVTAETSYGPASLAFDGTLAQEGDRVETRLSLADGTLPLPDGELQVERLEVAVQGTGGPLDFQATGRIAGELALSGPDGLTADPLTFDLPIAVSRDGGAIGLRLDGPGKVTLAGVEVPTRLTVEGPLEATLAASETNLALADATFVHATSLALGGARLLIESEDGQPIVVETGEAGVTLAGILGEDERLQATAAVWGTALTLPDLGLALEGLSADLALLGDPEQASAAIQVAALKHLANPAAVAPLRAIGQAHRIGEKVGLTATVSAESGEALADLVGTHDLAGGSGRAEVSLRPLRFAPGGLQPSDLSPLLADIAEARGRVDGTANLTWGPEGRAGTARLAVEDLAFTGEGLSVSGLDLSLTLDRLEPPASPPGQSLRAKVIDLGVPIKNLDMRFSLPPDKPGQVLIEDAGFVTVGGRFAIRDTLFDPTGERLATRLRVDAMDMAVLFDLLAIDGLSGSGELVGTIPIRRNGERITVEDARLAARAPGVLRFRSDAAKRALEGGGEYVELVIQALQDFHYEKLVLTGNLDRTGEAGLRLEILGNNPSVMEGHPFQLNINLSADSTPILEAMLLSQTLLQEIMARARKLSK